MEAYAITDNPLCITIFGASGKVGQLLVDEALQRGHTVTAFVHSTQLQARPNLTIVTGDVHNGDEVRAALRSSNAVLCALSSWGTRDKNILSSAIQHIAPMMSALHISRIVSLTGAGAFDSTDKSSLLDQLNHALTNAVAPKILRDGEDHIQLLRGSDLDWTVIRSPVMTTLGRTDYQLSSKLPAPWKTIHRAAVATCMLDLVESRDWLQQSPIIIRS